MRTITTARATYVIRGPWTATELHRQYASFKRKYPDSMLSFDRWLGERGKVYFKKEDHRHDA